VTGMRSAVIREGNAVPPSFLSGNNKQQSVSEWRRGMVQMELKR
jgi:hypothetical protein